MNSLELIELSSVDKVGLIQISSCNNIGAIKYDLDLDWTSRSNSLELIELAIQCK